MCCLCGEFEENCVKVDYVKFLNFDENVNLLKFEELLEDMEKYNEEMKVKLDMEGDFEFS